MACICLIVYLLPFVVYPERAYDLPIPAYLRTNKNVQIKDGLIYRPGQRSGESTVSMKRDLYGILSAEDYYTVHL